MASKNNQYNLVISFSLQYSDIVSPRDAMHKHGLCRRVVSVRLSVCPSVRPSRSWTLSKRITNLQKYFTIK